MGKNKTPKEVIITLLGDETVGNVKFHALRKLEHLDVGYDIEDYEISGITIDVNVHDRMPFHSATVQLVKKCRCCCHD